jgi:hypothetical protein
MLIKYCLSDLETVPVSPIDTSLLLLLLLLLLLGVLSTEVQEVDNYLLASSRRIIADFVQSPFVVINSPKQYFCERCVYIEHLL